MFLFIGVRWRRIGDYRKMKSVYLFDLPLVACVCAGSIVGEGFRACEFMVGRGGCDDVALGGDLTGEAGDGAGYCWGRE